MGINQPIVPDGMGGLTGGAPFPGAQGQNVWQNGTGVPFTLEFDSVTNVVTYTVVGSLPIPLTATVGSENPTAIYLRTRATGAAPSGTATNLLSNLSLTDANGNLLIPILSSTGNPASDVDYLLIEDLTSSFTLTGLQTFSWDPSFPGGSNNASQIKVVYDLDIPPVPEPGAILGLLAVGGLGLVTRFKNKHN